MLYISTLLNLERMSLNQQSKVFHNFLPGASQQRPGLRGRKEFSPPYFGLKKKGESPTRKKWPVTLQAGRTKMNPLHFN